MKNIYELLQAKEMVLVRLRTEVDALRLVAPMLADHGAELGDVGQRPQPNLVWAPTLQKNKWPLRVGHPVPTYLDS